MKITKNPEKNKKCKKFATFLTPCICVYVISVQLHSKHLTHFASMAYN